MNNKRNQQTVWDAINISVDIDYYIRLVWARKWPVLAFGLLVSALALYFFLSKTPEYHASSSLLIESNIPRTMSKNGVYDPDSTSSEYFTTQVELLKSRKLMTSVINELDLWRNPELAVPNFKMLLEYKALKLLNKYDLHSDPERMEEITELAFDPENVLYAFSLKLDVRPVRHSKVIKIGYLSADPALSAAIANTVARKYISLVLELRDEVSQMAYEEHYQKLNEASVVVDDLTTQLDKYTDEKGISREITTKGYDEYNRKYLTEKLVKEKLEIDALESRLIQVQRALTSPTLEELNIPEMGTGLRELQRRYFEAKYEKQLLSENLKDEHPAIVELDSKLNSIRDMLWTDLVKVPEDIESRIKDAKNSYRKLKLELAGMEKREINSLSGQREYEKLLDELSMNERVQQSFSDKVKESLELKNSLFLVARVIDQAQAPIKPVGPRKIFVGAGSFIFGILFGSLFFVFKDLFDTRIKYSKRFELASGVKNLACIPSIKKPMDLFIACRKSDSPKELSKKERAFFESFRTFKANLTLELMSDKSKVIMIASSTPDEGKTTTSLWLANAFTSSERVLLIDGDVRRASLSSHLVGDDKKGLINALCGEEYKMETIGASQGIFDFLPAGSANVDPSAYFTGSTFRTFIDSIAHRYDRIIIDTSPVCAVADAMLLARQVDRIVLVTRSTMTQQKVALQSIERLAQAGNNIAGFVITDLEEKYYKHLSEYASYKSYDKYYSYREL